MEITSQTYFPNHVIADELRDLGFVPKEDSPCLCFFKYLPNSICVEAFLSQENLLAKVHVINEFEGPYDKSQDVCIVLNTFDIHEVLRFAGYINYITVDSQII